MVLDQSRVETKFKPLAELENKLSQSYNSMLRTDSRKLHNYF